MKSNKVLVIDDENAICEGCRLTLSEKGFLVNACMTGKRAVSMVTEDDYDLVLLDMRLPDMDGMEILRFIRQNRPGISVIVMTGYSSVENAVQAMKTGAFDYLTKPFTETELVKTADRAMAKKEIKKKNCSFRSGTVPRQTFSSKIVGSHTVMLKIYEAVQEVAPVDTTVLISGESGTGKELFAEAVHTHSKRAGRRFVPVDCGTFSSTLLESELFGYVRGAFTGAVKDKPGIFATADNGTLFLDEIANLDLDFQAKLLRTMETFEFKPLGACRSKKSDVRIIAATNRDLETMVYEGRFRQDLFYRLNVFPLFIPPLRQRKSDIPDLLYHFLDFFRRRTGKQIEGFTDDALEELVNYDWPGNVRQLRNVVERLVITADEPLLDYSSIVANGDLRHHFNFDRLPATLEDLKDVKHRLIENQFGPIEKAFLQKAILAADGNITRAARQVGMQRSNFSALLKKHSLTPAAGKKASKNPHP